jgi:hypothetical protein
MLILPKLIPLLHPLLVATSTGSDPSFINPAPDPTQLPGSNQILSLVGGVRWAALVCCLVALIVGAAVWAFSSHSGNPYQTSKAKVAVLGALLGVFVVGAAPALIQWLYDLGTQVSG